MQFSWTLKKLHTFILFYICKCSVCMYVCAPCACLVHTDVRRQTVVTHGSELPCGLIGIELVFSEAEPFLQPQFWVFF